ncbi:MAG: coiled-coil domain-containing protein [Planctomycetota bacterium]|jgi:hypothetical protein
MRLPHPYVLFLSCASALILACGCEDSQAQQRAEVQKIIKAATEQLSAATAVRVDMEQQDQLRRDLTALITKLSNTTGGEPGQRAAASRLAGNAHRTLASIDLTAAERLEADHRSRRWVVDGMIDAALELDAVAAAREAIDTSDEQDRLAEDRDAASAQLQEHSEHMATLDGPIAEIRRRNRDDRDQAERLREEASQLRREASELGPGEGYTTFERSLQLDRQADQIEYEVARRELELRFILEPEHDVARKRIEQARHRIETDDSARQGLEDAAQATSAEARATRAGVGELGEQIATALSEIEQASTGTLADLYDRGGSNLEKAASKAKAAATMARGEGTDAARVEAARAYQQLGDMYWLKARGLDQDIALRQRLADHAGALGSVVASPGADASLASLREAHRGAMAQAADAYRNAQDVLGQVSGRTARRRLEALRARMSALLEEEPPPATPEVGRRPSAAEAPAPTADGAASPEALVQALRNAGDLESFTDIQLNLTHIEIETQIAGEIYEASADANRAMVELDTAMQEKLGGGLGLPEVSLGQVSGDRAAITITVLGQPRPLELIRIDGMWYVDATDQFNAQIAQAAAMGLDETAVLTMAQTQAAAIREVVGRVRAGEFSSVPETLGALGQAIMQAMQGLAGP